MGEHQNKAGKDKGQSLKKDAAYVYVGHVLRYLSPLILVPYYSRVLGPDGYGQVLAALSLMAVINTIVSYGFFFSGVRDLASARDSDEAGKILGKQIEARLILVPIACLIGLGGTIFSPLMLENPAFGILATFLGITNAFGFSWFFQGIRKFKMSIFLDSLIYPLNIILVLLMVHSQKDGLLVLVSLSLSSIVCLGISYALVRKKTAPVFSSMKDGLKEIKETTMFFLSSMSFTLLTIGSTYVLSMMAASDEVGYFGTAERFISLAVGLLNPLGMVLMPTISSLHKDGSDKVHGLVRKGILLETGYGIIALFGGMIAGPMLIPFFLGAKFDPSVTIFQIMVALLPFAAIKHALILYVLIPLRKEKYYMITSSLNVSLSLILAVAFVPSMGAIGMAGTRVVAEITATCFLLVVLYKQGLLKKGAFKLS